MTMTVERLITILDSYDSNSLVKVFDASLNELSHLDRVFGKDSGDGMDVVIVIRED